MASIPARHAAGGKSHGSAEPSQSEAQPAQPPPKRHRWFGLLAVALLPIGLLSGGIVINRHVEAAIHAPRMPRRSVEETELKCADNWRVAIIGDTRSNNEVREEGLRLISSDRVDATLFLGDLVGHPSHDKMTGFAIEAGEAVEECPGIGELFFLPGNHDRDSRTGLELYEKYFGRPYQAVRLAGTLFLLLDNSSLSISPPQRQWIEGKLSVADSQGLAAYLCMHYPPASPGVKKSGMTPDSDEFLARAVAAHPSVRMILASHLHGYAEGTFVGKPLYVTGGGGAPLEQDAEFHYLLLERSKPGGHVTVTYRPIPDPGHRLARLGPRLYRFETMSLWVFWLGAVVFSMPMIAWLWWRRRAPAGRQLDTADSLRDQP